MKRLLQTLSQKWPEYLLEILVLIIGIYGAFALENWNDRRKEKTQEKVVLESLLSDFKINEQLINDGINDHKENLRLCIAMARLLGQEASPANIQTLDSLCYYSAEYTAVELISSTVLSVASGNQLSLLQNEALKKMLVAYPTHVQLYKEREMLVRSIVVDLIRPSIEKYISMAHWNDLVEDHFKSDYEGLIKDMQISNHYHNRYYQIRGCLQRLESLAQANAGLSLMIEQELKDRFE